MKYLLIMYVDHEMWEGLTADQQLSAFQGDGDFDRLISETGELVESKTLSDPITAKTVHVRDGVPSTIDSPVHKSDAFVCGYYVVDVTDEKRAVELAGLMPDAAHGAIEVREVLHESGPVNAWSQWPV
ncbi:YciI family protein [Fodinicola feengrottensis]|uniref:YciI family protein n=1 Tax=Fodinicola feengrottensis TaxID=435914 RepID=A0ABN2FPJ0_9ACTN